MATERDGRPPPPTPIPTDLLGLARSVAQIEGGVESIRRDLLPPVAKAAGRARDGVVRLEGSTEELARRVGRLESSPPPPHDCHQESVLRGHGETLTGQEKELAGLTRWRTYLATILVPLLLALLGAGGKAVYDAAMTKAQVEETSREVQENSATLRKLTVTVTQDRETILQELRAVPAQVEAAREDMTLTETRARLSDSQRRRLDRILREASISGQ